MGCLTRRFITEPERQQIFDRWFKGESQYSIARSLGRGHTSIQGVLSRTGGIRPMPVVGGARRDIAPEPLAGEHDEIVRPTCEELPRNSNRA
jgi:hypothetical protein